MDKDLMKVWGTICIMFVFIIIAGFFKASWNCEKNYENSKYENWVCLVELDWKYIKEDIYKEKIDCKTKYEVSKYEGWNCLVELDWKFHEESLYKKLITWEKK